MKKVILFVHEHRLREQLSSIKEGCHYLQGVYDGLVSLGADADQITVDDLRSLMIADGNPAEIKKIILRGKVLQVASMMIAKESIHFDQKALQELSRVCRNSPSYLEQGDHYEIVNGKIKCVDSLEDDLRPKYTLYGSPRQKAIADKMAAIAEQINALRTEIGHHHTHAPMRLPESWYTWNTRGEYVVDMYRVSKYIAP